MTMTMTRLFKVRPLLLLYPLPSPETKADKKKKPREAPASVKEDTSTPDGFTAGSRLQQGVASVRRLLVDSQVVDVKTYSPDDPTIIRALQEEKIKPSASREIDESARLKVARNIGAMYVMTVAVDKIENRPPIGAQNAELSTENVRLIGVLSEVKTRKRWKEEHQTGANTTPMGSGMASETPTFNRVSNNALVNRTIYDTLANTVVMRFLAGPLRVYAKSVPDPAMLPQNPRPLEITPESLSPQEEAQGVRLRAEALIRDNRVEDGIQILKRSINLTPRSSEGRIALIQAYLDNQYLSEAIVESRRALQVVPSSDKAGRQKIVGLLLEAAKRKGDSNTSRVTLERLLQDDPNNIDLRVQYGEILFALNDRLEAARVFQEVTRLSPGNLGAYTGLVRLAIAEGDIPRATRQSEDSSLSALDHCLATQVLVQEVLKKVHTDFVHNKLGWEQSTLSRELFYKSLGAQQDRLKMLLGQNDKYAPPIEATEAVVRTQVGQKKQLNLLTKILKLMETHLETGDSVAKVSVGKLLEDWEK
jgi:cytochrome c-type biogenesis protein CcmH/NrfG